MLQAPQSSMLSQSAKHEVRVVANFEIKDYEQKILHSRYTAAYS